MARLLQCVALGVFALLSTCIAAPVGDAFGPGTPKPLQGNVSAVEELLERVLPGARAHFRLSIDASACSSSAGCFTLEDGSGGTVKVTGSTTSDVSAGVGAYLMDHANMTIGWARGGGQNLHLPQHWPTLGQKVTKRRNTPWSYIMNVCTHSYSLVWYSWSDWEAFIDWQSLWGINLNLAMTGQEEVQWKVFTQLGLNDSEIRGWFNGPALLTWSRGQNEYGAGIAGPLPRSWMKNQWHLQKKILARYRQLGIVGQLPGFQGNMPVGIKALRQDSNISVQGATGWIDSLDPLYAEVADLWMKTLVADFGTDHWYQLDGYLNGGTAPWMDISSYDDLRQDPLVPRLRSANTLLPVATQPARSSVHGDPAWKARGVAAYTGLNRTDPAAVWSFQGFAFVGWSTDEKAAWLKGFIDAVPEDHFNVVDMGYSGSGEWHKWNDSSFFETKYVWTALMNFGGTNGIKGNLTHMNEIPFQALAAKNSIWGSGMTSEGIDQNPALYDFLNGQNWRDSPVPSIPDHLVARAHRRYGLIATDSDVTTAWELLSKYKSSMYQQDVSVQDFTGVHNFPGGSNWDWVGAGCRVGTCTEAKPSDTLCKTFFAWEAMVRAASRVGTKAMTEPMRYDLIDLGRDVLARLTTPISQNFSASLGNGTTTNPVAFECARSGQLYVDLLMDLNELVGTDQAFLLGSWESMARKFAEDGSDDCTPPDHPEVASCADFYVWNARIQLTTWAGGYAGKHWNGLLKGWYAERISRLMKAGLAAATESKPLTKSAINKLEGALASEFTTDFQEIYPEEPTGDPVSVSLKMIAKYRGNFDSCAAPDSRQDELNN